MGRTTTLDLDYLGRAGIISVHAAPTGDGSFVLLDSGPASTLDALERGLEAEGLAMTGLQAVLLTHVHLDHAAAAGALALRTGCEVWVHPDGVPHLADPGARLLPSALRLPVRAKREKLPRAPPRPPAPLVSGRGGAGAWGCAGAGAPGCPGLVG